MDTGLEMDSYIHDITYFYPFTLNNILGFAFIAASNDSGVNDFISRIVPSLFSIFSCFWTCAEKQFQYTKAVDSMWNKCKKWWNTPAENLITKGHNTLFFLGFILPLGIMIVLSIFKIFGLPLSWKEVCSPSLLFILLLGMAFSPSARDIIIGKDN